MTEDLEKRAQIYAETYTPQALPYVQSEVEKLMREAYVRGFLQGSHLGVFASSIVPHVIDYLAQDIAHALFVDGVSGKQAARLVLEMDHTRFNASGWSFHPARDQIADVLAKSIEKKARK